MKLITILLTIFVLKTCGSSEQLMTKSNFQDMTLSGVYTISVLVKTNISTNLTIEFNSETKKVSGFSGCNRYFGTYTVSKDSMSIGPLASTRKYCIGEANDIEYKFQNALSKVNSFLIDGNEISLLNGDEVLIKAKRETNGIAQKGIDHIITYTATSRGFYKSVIFQENTISFQNNRNDKTSIYKCTREDIETIAKLLNNIELATLPKLEPPSKAHQYDGAALATLSIEHSGQTYQTNTFDHGNPPPYISELVNLILALTESI